LIRPSRSHDSFGHGSRLLRIARRQRFGDRRQVLAPGRTENHSAPIALEQLDIEPLFEQFDDADRIISQARLDVHYVPGEHDFLDPDRKFYVDRYRRGTKGAGWYSFDADGVHFIGLVNVFNLQGGGMGDLGADQLEWLEDDLKARSASTPIVIFAHIPLWTIYPEWGWGTDDSAQALSYLKRFGSVTVLNGHIHQIMQKVEGNVTFHTARSTAFPQPAPGTASSPGPIKDVPADKLRSMLGIANVTFKQNEQRLAIVDSALQA
jgi:3',5'-cyclic AMP phosphodiesterase CpdA